MNIKEINIKGWRSYSPRGIELNDLKKINLIIGPNNSGKTNIVRYFNSIKRLFNNYGSPEVQVACYLKEEDTWMNSSDDVYCVLILESQGGLQKLEATRTLKGNKEIFKYNGNNDLGFSNWKFLSQNQVKIFSDVRGYTNTYAGLEHHVDGIRVADYIFNKGINDYEWYKQFQFDMSRWLSSLLNEEVKIGVRLVDPKRDQSPYVEDNIVNNECKNNHGFLADFDEPLKRAEFEVNIKKKTLNIKHQPQDLGMGVLQFIFLLSALYQEKDTECIIFIEEPEQNLHAKSISDIVHILETDEAFSKHQYFLITHSNVILNLVNANYSVHRFQMSESGSTEVTCCTKKVDNYGVLDLLGVQPSQLFLSNIVLWVEGPSDRIYIKRWIEMANEKYGKNFVEGKHYSFVFYGGSLLDHYTVLEEDENLSDFIDILQTSRYAIIVCDSDLGGTRNQYKDRVKRIMDRLNANRDLAPYVYQWITDGREIENYVPKELFIKVICEKIKKRSYFDYTKEKLRHFFENPNPDRVSDRDFENSFSFDEFFARMYIREEELENVSLVKAIINNVSKSFDKVLIANKITELWDDSLHSNSQLDNHLGKIIQMLENANR
ncbi:ATP-dependent nuclease [Peribacillus simplex]|uniref:ATP-dependent nuclease n=1 Tax=Peribacillus simplex TaxID=1478 RepID=UPI001484D906|nr:AAA family ATPase [Peribacillus simplex]